MTRSSCPGSRALDTQRLQFDSCSLRSGSSSRFIRCHSFRTLACAAEVWHYELRDFL